MSRRLDKTLADYLAIAVSPALIMTLVGSLVFFLLEVFYVGQFEERLRWIMALFVTAAVLIGRISIEEGSERAAVFALPLAAVTAMAIYKLVSHDTAPLLASLGLMGLIWWSTHKLTWDCTLIDEDEDASGEGLLQVVGLDESPAAADSPGAVPPAEPEGVTSPDATPLTWPARLADQKKRPHAPGVWIIYFSLAALSVFGLGQRLVPADDVDARRYVFRLLCVYTASGFGLLLTTSFLGLRRYLRQRRLPMPASMAGAWIATGCLLIAVILAFAALLPRPASEYAVSELPFGVGALDHKSSRYAVGDEGVDDDQRKPRPGKPANEPQHKPRQTEEEHRQPDDQAARDESREGTRPKQTKDRQPDRHTQGSGQQQPGNSGGDQSQQRGSPTEGKSKRRQKGSQSGESRSENESSRKSHDDRKASSKNDRQRAEGSPSQSSEKKDQEDRAGEPGRESSRLRRIFAHTSGQWLTAVFRWLLYGVLLVVGAVWLWRSWDKVRAAFREWMDALKAFWQGLFGSNRETTAAESESDEKAAPAARPFSSFADPFAAGTAGRYSPDALVRYSFEALEAWARDHGWPRQPDETPHEFARQVGTHVTSLSREARRLADLYCTVAYARGPLPEASVDHVRQLWRQLRPVAAAQQAGPT